MEGKGKYLGALQRDGGSPRTGERETLNVCVSVREGGEVQTTEMG